LLPSIYPRLRNSCLAINNFSLLVSADMSHVPVAWQWPGWNIHPFCLRYFDLLGSTPHCSLLIQSSKRAKLNCHIHRNVDMPKHIYTHPFIYTILADSPRIYKLSFYNLRDQLLLSIYPWLWNHCLAINSSSLLVSADMSHVPIAWQQPGWNIIFREIFRPSLWIERRTYLIHAAVPQYPGYLFSQSSIRQEKE
jgi:hypothetical protein